MKWRRERARTRQGTSWRTRGGMAKSRRVRNVRATTTTLNPSDLRERRAGANGRGRREGGRGRRGIVR